MLCFFGVKGNAMEPNNQETSSACTTEDQEVKSTPEISFFNAPAYRVSEPIFLIDPAIIGQNLPRPHRPLYVPPTTNSNVTHEEKHYTGAVTFF